MDQHIGLPGELNAEHGLHPWKAAGINKKGYIVGYCKCWAGEATHAGKMRLAGRIVVGRWDRQVTWSHLVPRPWTLVFKLLDAENTSQRGRAPCIMPHYRDTPSSIAGSAQFVPLTHLDRKTGSWISQIVIEWKGSNWRYKLSLWLISNGKLGGGSGEQEGVDGNWAVRVQSKNVHISTLQSNFCHL